MFFLSAVGATGEPGAAGSPGKDGFTSILKVLICVDQRSFLH